MAIAPISYRQVFGDKIGSAPLKPHTICNPVRRYVLLLEWTWAWYWLSAFSVCVWAFHGGDSNTWHRFTQHTLSGTHTADRMERFGQTVNANVTFVSHIGSEYTNVLTANWYGCHTEVSVSVTGQQVIARYCTHTSDFWHVHNFSQSRLWCAWVVALGNIFFWYGDCVRDTRHMLNVFCVAHRSHVCVMFSLFVLQIPHSSICHVYNEWNALTVCVCIPVERRWPQHAGANYEYRQMQCKAVCIIHATVGPVS